MPLDDRAFAELLDVRAQEPERIAKAHAARRRRTSVTRDGMLFIVAADHTARGVLGVVQDERAMANRRSNHAPPHAYMSESLGQWRRRARQPCQ